MQTFSHIAAEISQYLILLLSQVNSLFYGDFRATVAMVRMTVLTNQMRICRCVVTLLAVTRACFSVIMEIVFLCPGDVMPQQIVQTVQMKIPAEMVSYVYCSLYYYLHSL